MLGQDEYEHFNHYLQDIVMQNVYCQLPVY